MCRKRPATGSDSNTKRYTPDEDEEEDYTVEEISTEEFEETSTEAIDIYTYADDFFLEDTTEAEEEEDSGIDVKKIVIIAVIVVAVAGAGACLVILSKKQ